jgi:transposase-like protein
MLEADGRAKAREWQARFDRYRKSRTTVAAFCRRESVSVAMFYYWRRELGAGASSRPVPTGVSGGFAPVRLLGSSNVVVHLPGGTRLEIPMSDSEAFTRALQTLVQADLSQVEQAPC